MTRQALAANERLALTANMNVDDAVCALLELLVQDRVTACSAGLFEQRRVILVDHGGGGQLRMDLDLAPLAIRRVAIFWFFWEDGQVWGVALDRARSPGDLSDAELADVFHWLMTILEIIDG